MRPQSMSSSRRPRRQARARPTSSAGSASTPEMVHSPDRLREVAEELAESEMIAFDTEFLRERTYFPQLGLVQIADRKTAWLVDPLELSRDDLKPLLDVLTDPKILKIAHSAEQDQECLAHDYGITARPLLDTSIAAALTGRGDQIGLAPLLRKELGVNLPKGHTRTNWLKRPLQDAMADYAAADVIHLVELGEKLLKRLDKLGRRKWALKLSDELAEPARYEANGEQLARKLAANSRMTPREYAVFRELVSWREHRVRKSDIPRRWLAEDSTLIQLARARPSRAEDLADFRGLGGRVRDFGAAKILEAIDRGMSVADEDLEAPPRKLEPTPKESAGLGVFKCFLQFLAQENDVPLRYLMDGETPLLLLRGEFPNLRSLEESGLLSDGALEYMGEELLAILSGRRAMKIENGRPVRFDPERR